MYVNGDQSIGSLSITSLDSLDQFPSLMSWIHDLGLYIESSSSEEESEPAHFVNNAHFRYVMNTIWSEETLRAYEQSHEDIETYRQFLSNTTIFKRLLGMVASHMSEESYFPSGPVFNFSHQEPLSQSSSYESMLELIRDALSSMAVPREEEASFSDDMLAVSNMCSSSEKCETNTRSSIISTNSESASTSATSFTADQSSTS